MRRRRPATLAEAARRGLTRGLVIATSLAAGYGAVALGGLAGDLVTETRPPADVMTGRPHAAGSPPAAMAKAERAGLTCWQGEAPRQYRGAIPGHVVWQHPDGRTVVSARLVGPALDTLFGDGTLAGDPIAFCFKRDAVEAALRGEQP